MNTLRKTFSNTVYVVSITVSLEGKATITVSREGSNFTEFEETCSLEQVVYKIGQLDRHLSDTYIKSTLEQLNNMGWN